MTWTHQTYLITMLTDWEANQTEQSWNVRSFLYEWASERFQAFVYQTSRDSDTPGRDKRFCIFLCLTKKRYWYKYSCVIITPMITVNLVCRTVGRDCPPKRLVKYTIFSIYLKSQGHCWQRHNPYSPLHLPLPRPSEPTQSVTLIWLVTWSGDYSVLLASLFSRGFSVETTRLYAQNMQISRSLRL